MGDTVTNQKIAVIAPLDWGLGHISRSMYLATQLKQSGFEVWFAVPKTLTHFAAEHGFKTIPIVGYNVKYYSKLHPLLSLILQLPKFVLVFFMEYFRAKDIAKTYNPTLIISDNRLFFRHRNTVNIYISHQLNLPLVPIFQKLVHPLYYTLIEKFDLCFVPDTTENTYAGMLSKNPPIKIPVHYCGIMSRFQHLTANPENPIDLEYTILYIASGPQPQRNETSKKVVSILSQIPGKHAMIGYVNKHKIQDIDFFSHLPTKQFFNLASRSKVLFSKSGYTTIMDAVALQKPLIMWPTKGQWEQQFLARHLKNKQGFVALSSPEEMLKINFNDITKPPRGEAVDIKIIINQFITEKCKTPIHP